MISSSVVYDYSVKYSYEIPHEYLSGSGNGNFPSRICSPFPSRIPFFTLFQKKFFHKDTRITFSGQLFLQSSCFFLRSSFFRTVTFSQHFFFQNSYFFRAKFLPSKHILRIGKSLVHLPFGTATYRKYLQKSHFFEADSSAQKSNLLHYLLFLESYLFNAFFINRNLL